MFNLATSSYLLACFSCIGVLYKPLLKAYVLILSYVLTKYRSVATDTKIKSSPTRTFSPSDRCLLAGWTVHQQASPWLCSCKPTSKDSLSLDDDVERHAKYWMDKGVLREYYLNMITSIVNPYHITIVMSEKNGIAIK